MLLVLVGLGCAILVSTLGDQGSSQTVVPNADPGSSTSAPVDSAGIFVHILGAVEKPGLYELAEGDRAVDVVAAAGGFLDTADQSQLNLARVLVDGEQIVVPVLGEAPPAEAPGVASDGKVNLNTATVADLETLPRIGPALAERILAWRDAHGSFASVDDLRSVSGIGEKTFEQLKDLVTT